MTRDLAMLCCEYRQRNKQMTKTEQAANVSIGTVIFAAGNKYLVKSIAWNEGVASFEVTGMKFKKHSETWPKKSNKHMIGSHFEVVEGE